LVRAVTVVAEEVLVPSTWVSHVPPALEEYWIT
jgi:hypothetical protein